MSSRTVRTIVAATVAACCWSSQIRAQEVVTNPYPGIKLVKRTDIIALPLPSRQVKMNIVFVDLNAPEVRFKMTPAGENLPPDLFGSPGWPTPFPPFEVVRQSTLGFLEAAHGQVAINSHFFAPFPVPAGSNQGAWAYLIGLAASRGNVYSGFETPFQIYALAPDAPAINIDRHNNASIVHRDPAFADGLHVSENVTLWNALSGSAQIITDGVKTLPLYRDADHPDAPLIGPGPANYSNSNSWYNLINARSAIGLTQDNRTLALFTVDVRPSSGLDRSQGMRVGEVADVLLGYGVWNALNLDGGGSTTMAMQDPADNLRKLINVSSDAPAGRVVASSLAVYSDGLDPVTTVITSPAANANGWNNTSVAVTLDATDLRSGISGSLPGWVDQLQYVLAGAQTSNQVVVPGHGASIDVTATGITNVTYFATDAAGNDENTRTFTVRLDETEPVIGGLPASGCTLWPPTLEMIRVAVVNASDVLSGVAPGSLQVTATSSEPSDPSAPDTRVTPDGAGGFVVELRAARLGSGRGRRYTITATAKDLADNTHTTTATCLVPHDMNQP
jgi:Phosphodiester glycosidase